jgi:hypothetical protein
MESWSDPAPTAASGPRRPAVDRIRGALDAIAEAVASPAFSLESVRRLVVRYGAIARDQALQVDEMIPALSCTVAEAIAPMPTAQRDEMLASVQWWAVHGYHRAD